VVVVLSGKPEVFFGIQEERNDIRIYGFIY
jgi:hypothetical protein